MGRIFISFSGAGAGFSVILAALGVMYALGYGYLVSFDPLFSWAESLKCLPRVVFPNLYLSIFVILLFQIWVYWGIINLLPVYPLDGGHISQEICQAVNAREGVRWSLQLSAATGSIIAAASLWFWIKTFASLDEKTNLRDLLLNQHLFIAVLFGYLAYQSYLTLQSYTRHRGW